MLKLDIFKRVVEKLYLSKQEANSRKVIVKKSEEELKKIFDLSISKDQTNIDEIEAFIDNYIKYSTNTNSNQFFNQFFTGGNLPSILGEIVTAFTNSSMYTYEVAPVATLIEKKLIEKMNAVVGYKNGDGIFTTGGSNANMIAMFSARNKFFNSAIFHGLSEVGKLTAFVSDQMHYSFQTAANLLGLGIKNLIKVKSDSQGRMIVEELEAEVKKSIKRGEKPFFVCGIAGTTVLGAFDDFVGISDVAKRYGLWFHVDGALGGTFLLSDKKEQFYKGVELSDSFTWDAHKLMNIPFVCSVILTKQQGVLDGNLSHLNKEYLFHNSEEYELDLGVKSLQCGRNVDALKLWIAWKFYGDKKYTEMANNLLDIAQYFAQKVKEDDRLEILNDPESVCICYRVKHPNSNEFNLKLREKLLEQGGSMVNYTYIDGDVYIRFVNVNMDCTKEHIDIYFKNFYKALEAIS